MTTTYTGKVVLVERVNPSETHSSYNDGQYLIYAETGSQLFGHRMDGSYGGLGVYALSGRSGTSGIPLAGEAAYRVVAVDNAEQWMLDALDSADEEIRAVRAGERKADWIGGVYESAENRSRQLRKTLEKALAEPEPEPGESAGYEDEPLAMEEHTSTALFFASVPLPPTVRITVPAGVQVLVTTE
ncbi:hypothetical protein [Streptomyces sp. NRRL S-350]|uniref:hypothetical protein n=1 Tax=Streptomyces sp. NRRL S-350 TaxID=1463902 RepID=UPI0004BF1F29|nr:hypothetical protein [Streptomyces sp. NRRL S-350]